MKLEEMIAAVQKELGVEVDVGVLGTDLGLDWGGNWTSIVDQPHFQLRPAWSVDLAEKEMLAELRGRLAAGTPVFA